MSGHSRWAGIKRKKAAIDARRGKVFAKMIRLIEVAAREGGTSNPENNMTLAGAIERARAALVPADTIERAAKRGAGELGNVQYERVVYEGYAPGGVALLVETLTDNRNRTGQEIRSVFTRGGGNLGEPGSVAWMFERRGLFTVAGSASEDAVLEAAADGGADDVHREGDDWEIVSEMKDFDAVRQALESAGLKILTATLTMLPTTTVPVDADRARAVIRLMEALEELDDVQDVYPACDLPEEILAEVS